ncbi:DegT/DnrJ/EryC1/StrS family aminotransferase [Erythrobacter sp. GH1-10]|uniref:DegT/DnrJ/EryC1/StrS family aminotransferase n=1 Tax=Erythrobacter sp. GH1-10 TaxID=3349334 RepID=UPI003877B9B6
MELRPQEALAPVHSQWPRFEPDEIEAATLVLRSGRVNGLVHGEKTAAFAQAFTQYCGAKHGFCVANGTLALEVALRALGIGQGDEVIVSARSFFASASAILAVGARPAFADVSSDSQNLDPASVERLVTDRTRAILCVHLAGWPCEMTALQEIADAHDLLLVEDCAQAHGASIASKRVGSFGDAAAFSFCTDKIMSTAGEGGLVLFKDEAHYEAGRSYKDHGKNFAKMSDGQGEPGQFRFIHDLPGSNFRLTEFQAAIGLRQLEKLPIWLEQRSKNAEVLLSRFAGDERLRLPLPAPEINHAWYKFYVQLTLPEDVEGYRAQVINRLHASGIPAGSGSCPDMSREKAFAGMEVIADGQLQVARELGTRTIMVPVDHTLSQHDMHRIADALLAALEE